MKAMTILMSMSILMGSCLFAQAQAPSTNPGLQGKVTTRVLPEAVRQALDVKPDDLVIAVKQDGSKIIYESQGRSAKVVENGQLPQYKLQHSIMIYGLQNSPTCYYYWDNNGNKVWYPVPDCPH